MMSNKSGAWRWWAGAAALLAGLAASNAVYADTMYSYYYVAGQATYTAATDSEVQVPLYLEEVSSNGTSLLSGESGVSAAGLNVSATAAPSSPAYITGLQGNAGTPPIGFDGTVGPASVSGASASLLESTSITASQGVAAGPQSGGISDVFLGTLTVHTGAIAGQTTTFTIGPYSTTSGNTFTNNNGYDLDNNLDPGNPAGSSGLYSSAAATTFDIETSAVPEPGALALSAAGVLLAGVYYRGRRRAVAAVRVA
jgi:hypothetical protein